MRIRFCDEQDVLELGERATLDLFVESHAPRRSLSQWCRHLGRIIQIARERAGAC